MLYLYLTQLHHLLWSWWITVMVWTFLRLVLCEMFILSRKTQAPGVSARQASACPQSPRQWAGAAVCLAAQWCPTLCDPMDCSPPGSSVHGILQARTLEWVTMPFSRGSSPPRDWTLVSRTAGGFFTVSATREALGVEELLYSLNHPKMQTKQSNHVSISQSIPRSSCKGLH